MRLRCLALALLLSGCSASDPCSAFAGQTCITLEVRGGARIDQIRLDSTELQIVDGLSPQSPGGTLGLPVQLAVVPANRDFAGAFTLDVNGLSGGATVGSDRVSDSFILHEHRRLVADLGGIASDGGVADLAQAPDLSGLDLAGADLSQTGPHWVSQTPPPLPENLWASGPNDLWCTTNVMGGVLRSTGDGNWRTESVPVPGAEQGVYAIWGSGPSDIYAVGEGFVAHSTGNGVWTPPTVPASTGTLYTVGGFDSTHVWAGGDNIILRRQGTGAFTAETSGLPVSFVVDELFATSDTDVRAIGSGSTIFHSVGDGSWTSQTSVLDTVQLWGTNPSNCLTPPCGDLWAIGTGKIHKLLHSTGDGSWPDAPVVPNTNGGLFSVGGIGPTEVYVGGDDGFIARFDGTTWTQEPTDLGQSGVGIRVESIFAVAPGDVYATIGTVILHRVTN